MPGQFSEAEKAGSKAECARRIANHTNGSVLVHAGQKVLDSRGRVQTWFHTRSREGPTVRAIIAGSKSISERYFATKSILR